MMTMMDDDDDDDDAGVVVILVVKVYAHMFFACFFLYLYSRFDNT